jgi:predicted Zn-dependent protease
VKRILLAGVKRDYEAAKRAFDAYNRWAERETEGYRVARYDLAVAAYRAGDTREAVRITTELIDEYYQLLDLGPEKLYRKKHSRPRS